jgi:hypothetical protein
MYRYVQKVISWTKRAESGAEGISQCVSGSVPYQNIADPEHWYLGS